MVMLTLETVGVRLNPVRALILAISAGARTMPRPMGVVEIVVEVVDPVVPRGGSVDEVVGG